MNDIPIITHRARIALWIALALSIVDFILMVLNLGITSFFLGLCATCASIIHLSTHLIVIRVREKRALPTSAPSSDTTTDANRISGAGTFPPTSTLGSILVSVGIAVFYIAAFAVSVFGFATSSIYRVFPFVGYFDAAFEVLCAGALGWLLYVGIKGRKGYLEITRMTKPKEGMP
ncbi:hypothetical protein P691DRAFT_807971 [Macrolepiota fuliginosa MF-IS2]|uniref:Uncharacterized protein n=1 Tax=Macrolepiota fuliginosa MF-IS2 TaxID=1400762 RepID=A0A9P5X647_9AGAR|nr:hypothetical protein P691DRAFT_807971 [Macrolepiota fuliginosa MF-IS2]